MKEFFLAVIQKSLDRDTTINSFQPIVGGCINSCFLLTTNKGNYFLKYNSPLYLNMFEKEMEGLKTLNAFTSLTIPQPLKSGIVGNHSFLIMTYLQSGPPAHTYWEQLGQGLAKLHGNGNHQYGWHTDNYIGRLPQVNSWKQNWIDFFLENRLEPQISAASKANLLSAKEVDQFQKLAMQLPDLLPIEPPSLLHGDLWSGNVMVGSSGEPCLVDPAVYYGHREVELAFTTLFGGFDERFYHAYQEEHPLLSGFKERFDLYNLYPLLVHLNLFGSGYLGDIKRIIERY